MAKGLGLVQRNGFWYVRKRLNGRHIRETTGIEVGEGARAKELKAAAVRRATEILKGVFEKDRGWKLPPLFGEWWDEYINGPAFHNTRTGGTCKELTMKWKRDSAKMILPHFSSMRIDQVTKSDCQAFMAKLSKQGYAPGTVFFYAMHAKAAFSTAVEKRLLAHNPWKGVKLPEPKRHTRVLSVEDQEKLFDELDRRLDDDQWYRRESVESLRNFIVVGIGTGLRLGAMLALGPQHIEKTEHGEFISIYSKTRMQRVPVIPAVRAALDAQAKLTTSEKKYFGYARSTIGPALHRLAEKAGIDGFSPHDLRRTFATRLVLGRKGHAAPVPLAVAATLLGHGQASTTQRFYSVTDTDESRSAALLDAAAALDLGK